MALLLVIGIPSGFLTSRIEARVERDTGYRLTIAGGAKVGLWPTLNVTLGDITLQDPKDRDDANRLTVGSVQADIALNSVWSGHPRITELVVHSPVFYVPLRRERDRQAADTSRPKASGDAAAAAIDRVTIIDGAMAFSNPRDRVENRISGINADITIGADRRIEVRARAQAGGQPLKLDITATMPAPTERQNIPVELTLHAPGALPAPLSAKAEVRQNGMIVMINGLSGTLGDSAFNGWASVDGASKPLVKLDLDFQRLEVAASKCVHRIAGFATGFTTALEQRHHRSQRAELCRRPGADFRGRTRHWPGAFRPGRDRRHARQRRAEGLVPELARLWRRAQRAARGRRLHRQPDLCVQLRHGRHPRAAAAAGGGGFRQARRQDAGQDRGEYGGRQPASHHVESRPAPCSSISRTASFAASMSPR